MGLKRGLCPELPLEFLTHDDVERFLALEFSRHHFPKEFTSLIYTKTEGSPLFMADVVRYLRDRRVIGEEAGSRTLVQTVPEIENDLPETVRSMIQRKIAQLSDEDRRLLIAASAQGYNFDSAVVAQALTIDAAEVEERLQSLDTAYRFVKYRKEERVPRSHANAEVPFRARPLSERALRDAHAEPPRIVERLDRAGFASVLWQGECSGGFRTRFSF